jgi:oligopeptide/dipeptide ABC transporter ATP-binding protein
MRQRAMIAMAISCNPSVLIADEPTTALDVTIQDEILQLLMSMCKDHDLGVMLVTHNMGVVADVCDEVAVMYAGEVVERADIFALFDGPKHPYTEGLLRSVPRLQSRSTLVSIPGSTPPPWQMPSGCRFAPRCPYAVDRCRSAPVSLITRDGRQSGCIRSDQLELRGNHG